MNKDYRRNLVVALYWLDYGITHVKLFLNTGDLVHRDDIIFSGMWTLNIETLFRISGDTTFENILPIFNSFDVESMLTENFLDKLYTFRKTLLMKAQVYPPQYEDVCHCDYLIEYLKEAFPSDISQTLL